MNINDDNEISESKAVALKYDAELMDAPQVVASGKGEIAQNIIKIAKENGVTIRSDKDLVEILAAIEVNSFIPLEAYTAVAEILSYIYNNSTSKQSSNSR